MGHPTANKIKADVYVYRQVGSAWVYVGEEHKTVNSSSLTISCKFNSIEGAYYRADYMGSMVGPSVNLVNNISLALVTIFGAIRFIFGQMTLGNISSFVLYS